MCVVSGALTERGATAKTQSSKMASALAGGVGVGQSIEKLHCVEHTGFVHLQQHGPVCVAEHQKHPDFAFL